MSFVFKSPLNGGKLKHFCFTIHKDLLPLNTDIFSLPMRNDNPIIDFNSTGDYSFPSVLDGDPVLATFNNFTINAGHTVTVQNRCKGLYLNILGDLVVNGTLSMTARGCIAEGRDVAVSPLLRTIMYLDDIEQLDEKYRNHFPLFIPKEGGLGGAGVYLSQSETGTVKNDYGKPGGTKSRGTGGGGSGGIYVNWSGKGTTGSGSKGTSFSGGSGGGGVGMSHQNHTAGSGEPNGGAGGLAKANSSASDVKRQAGGGAGNPGGLGAFRITDTYKNTKNGQSGTGGLLILMVKGSIIVNGSIQSHGSNGGQGNYAGMGGSSGGGVIDVYHGRDIIGIERVTAIGGTTKGYNSAMLNDGGAGSVCIQHISDLPYMPTIIV